MKNILSFSKCSRASFALISSTKIANTALPLPVIIALAAHKKYGCADSAGHWNSSHPGGSPQEAPTSPVPDTHFENQCPHCGGFPESSAFPPQW